MDRSLLTASHDRRYGSDDGSSVASDRRAEARVRPRDASSPSSAYSSSSSTRPYLPPRANYSPLPPPARVQRSESKHLSRNLRLHSRLLYAETLCRPLLCLLVFLIIGFFGFFASSTSLVRKMAARCAASAVPPPADLLQDLMTTHNLCGCFGSRWASLDSLAPASASLPVRYVSAHLNVSA